MTPKTQAQKKMPKPPARHTFTDDQLRARDYEIGQRAAEEAQQAERMYWMAVTRMTDAINYQLSRAEVIMQHAYDIATLMQRSEVSETMAQRELYKALWAVQGEMLRIYDQAPGWDDEQRTLGDRIMGKWLHAINAGENGDDGESIRQLARDEEASPDPDQRLVGLVRTVRKSGRKKVSAEAARAIELIEQFHIKGQAWNATSDRIIRYLNTLEQKTDSDLGLLNILQGLANNKAYTTPARYLEKTWKNEQDRRREEAQSRPSIGIRPTVLVE